MGKNCLHCRVTPTVHSLRGANRKPCVFYDSVVCVGGDGMFSEILHGLIGRTQQEAGFCENDPAVTLQSCSRHIGIIPAGKDSV